MALLELTNIAHVKQIIDLTPDDTEHDAVLQTLIEAVSQQAANYMDREVLAAQQTQYFDVTQGDCVYSLRAYPVTSIDGVGEGVWNDTAWDFTTALGTDYYRVNTTTGILYFQDVLVSGPQALKVIYTGGMATTAEKIMATYPDLAHAAARQVLYLFNTRRQIGAESVQVGDSSVYWRGDFAWMPGVKEVLDSYRRR